MVTQQSNVFRALADPTRREMLEILEVERLTVSELASRFPVSRPAISKHLRILREAGLVNETKEGRENFYVVVAEGLGPAVSWIRERRSRRRTATQGVDARSNARPGRPSVPALEESTGEPYDESADEVAGTGHRWRVW